jgi:hypothetical protein
VFKRVLAVTTAALLLAGCGGGGSGSVTPGQAPAIVPSAVPAAAQKVPFSIRIGGPISTAAQKRYPRYIPTATKTMGVKVGTDVPSGASFVNTFPSPEAYYDVSPSPSNPNCKPNGDGSRTCTIYLDVQPGNHIAILVDLFGETYTASFSATDPLATAIAEDQVVAGGGVNPISLTLNGVPASVTLGALSSVSADGSSPTTQTLHPVVKDAAGGTIIGAYAKPVVVSVSENNGSGHTMLQLGTNAAAASVSLASDADSAIAVVYDGWNGGASLDATKPYYATIASSGLATNGSAELDPLFVAPVAPAAAPLSLSVGTARNTQVFTPAEHGFSGTFTASASACAAGQFGLSAGAPFTATANVAGPACALAFGDGNASDAAYVTSTNTSTTVVIPSDFKVAPNALAVSKSGNDPSVGTTATAAISGGSAPYAVDASACGAVAAVAVSGSQLNVSSPWGTIGSCTAIVKDAAGNQFNVKVSDSEPPPPPLTVSPTQSYVSINGFMGAPYQADAYVSGGTPPYNWAPGACSGGLLVYWYGNRLHSGMWQVQPGQYCTGVVSDSAGATVQYTITERDY